MFSSFLTERVLKWTTVLLRKGSFLGLLLNGPLVTALWDARSARRCACCCRGPPYPKPAADPGTKAHEGDRVTAETGAADALWDHLCSQICQ